MDTLRTDLREKYPYATVRKLDNYGVEVRFRDDKARNDAISYLSSRHRDLVFSSMAATR